jgi:poly(hydroxyalkanoate) granule-associated protein
MVKKLHANADAQASTAAPKAAKKSAKGAAKSRKSADSAAKTLSAAGMAAMVQDSALAKSVKDSAEHIWLAGMGAFSKVQAEGGKVFEALVKEGQALQRKTQAVAEETIGEVAGRMTAMAGTVQSKAGQNWDKLEGIFEARTAKAMAKLGVPTAKDVQALIKRVDELAAAVAKLSRQAGAKAADTAVAAPARKRVAKRAAAPAGQAKAEAQAAVKVARRRPARKAAAADSAAA